MIILEKIKYALKYIFSSATYYITMCCYVVLLIVGFFLVLDWYEILIGGNKDVDLWLTVIRTIIVIFIFSFIYFITKWSSKVREISDEKLFNRNTNGNTYELVQETRPETTSEDIKNKIEEEIKINKHIESEKILSKEQIEKYTKQGVDNPLMELDNLIGMNKVKNEIKKLIAQFQFEKDRLRDGIIDKTSTANHIAFLGPAGTGKTTVARIMTSILYQNGYIKENKMIEINASDLTGVYLGQTKEKTRMFVESALGGVLFLDEAYSLWSGPSGNSYNDEATAVLVKAMEDYKEDFILIIAGYKEQTEAWLTSNEGLKSRIKLTIDFPNYTPDECVEILKSFAKNRSINLSESLIDEYKSYIRSMIRLSELCMSKRINTYQFGNARQVRNDLDKMIGTHSYALYEGKIDSSKRDYLDGEDIAPLKEEYFKLVNEANRVIAILEKQKRF